MNGCTFFIIARYEHFTLATVEKDVTQEGYLAYNDEYRLTLLKSDQSLQPGNYYKWHPCTCVQYARCTSIGVETEIRIMKASVDMIHQPINVIDQMMKICMNAWIVSMNNAIAYNRQQENGHSDAMYVNSRLKSVRRIVDKATQCEPVSILANLICHETKRTRTGSMAYVYGTEAERVKFNVICWKYDDYQCDFNNRIPTVSKNDMPVIFGDIGYTKLGQRWYFKINPGKSYMVYDFAPIIFNLLMNGVLSGCEVVKEMKYLWYDKRPNSEKKFIDKWDMRFYRDVGLPVLDTLADVRFKTQTIPDGEQNIAVHLLIPSLNILSFGDINVTFFGQCRTCGATRPSLQQSCRCNGDNFSNWLMIKGLLQWKVVRKPKCIDTIIHNKREEVHVMIDPFLLKTILNHMIEHNKAQELTQLAWLKYAITTFGFKHTEDIQAEQYIPLIQLFFQHIIDERIEYIFRFICKRKYYTDMIRTNFSVTLDQIISPSNQSSVQSISKPPQLCSMNTSNKIQSVVHTVQNGKDDNNNQHIMQSVDANQSNVPIQSSQATLSIGSCETVQNCDIKYNENVKDFIDHNGLDKQGICDENQSLSSLPHSLEVTNTTNQLTSSTIKGTKRSYSEVDVNTDEDDDAVRPLKKQKLE